MQQPEAAPAGPPAPPQGPARPPTPGRGSPDPQDPQDSPEAPREPEEEQEDGRPEDPEEDFSFLHCAACGSEPKAPKLLGCLHTLCGGCLGEPGAGCPACGEPGDTGVLDNAFFENLQRRLATHRQVVGARAPCSRCREPAAVWCPECEQLLCSCCSEAHGWFLKHEARPLAELRAQPASDFLDSTRRGCAIFCANSTHRVPTLTSIYCRGCDKPLCCACALLDRGHAEQQCDLGAEVRERQEELGAAVRALREQEATFREARGRAREAEGRLLSARAEAETVIRARVHLVLEHVRARERALLAAVAARFEREHATLGARLRELDAGLQRLRAGGALVARMERFASDQEVLDMHSFLRGALGRLQGQRPAGPAGLRPNCFAEFLVPLQDLVSDIRQAAALPVTTSPEPACIPRNPSEADLPEDLQGEEACTLGLAAVRPEPDAHPVPTFAFSIRAAPHSKEDAPAALPPKRKACQTESPHKLIKLELGGPCPQPRPSTSQAFLDGLPSPGSPKSPESLQSLDLGRETVNSSPAHEDLSEPGETEDRVVVLSSSEDSDPEGPPEDAETSRPPASPAPAPAPPGPGATPLRRPPHPPEGPCCLPDASPCPAQLVPLRHPWVPHRSHPWMPPSRRPLLALPQAPGSVAPGPRRTVMTTGGQPRGPGLAAEEPGWLRLPWKFLEGRGPRGAWDCR